MKKDIEKFKDDFNRIEIPDELSFTISESIKKGEKYMKKKRIRSRLITIAASLFIALTSLVVGVNTSPTFAQGVTNVIGSSTLVRILQFNQEKINEGETKVEGGEITDGKDIKSIDIDKQGETEIITIRINNGDRAAIDSAKYQIDYYKYPHSIVFAMSGVRAFSAANDFVNISGGELIGDIYRIMTLDDSAHRFGVTFKKPVELEIVEMRDPAHIIIKVKEDKNAVESGPVYSIRSASLSFGENVGYIEERLKFEFEGKNVRMMIDENKNYIVEEGYYNSEEEARARIDILTSQYDMDFKLYIEKRNPFDLPREIIE